MTIDFKNKKYSFDLDKLMKWVAATPSNEKNIDITITQTSPIFNEDNEVIEGGSVKEITETKSNLNNTMNQIRFEFMRMIMATVLEHYTNYVGENEFTPQQEICINTLKNKGILVELK